MSAAFVNESLCGALQSLTMYHVGGSTHVRDMFTEEKLDNMVFTGDRYAAID